MKRKYHYLIFIVAILTFFSNSRLSAESKTTTSAGCVFKSALTTDNSYNSAPEDTLFMTKKKFKRLFYEATGYFFDNHFAQALPLFIELLRVDPDNSHINFYVGACYMNLPEARSTALPYLQKAVKNTTVWYDYDYRSSAAPVFAYFYLASVYRNNYKLGDAIANNKIFKAFVSQENEELMSEVDREIKTLEGGNVYIEQPQYSKYFNKQFVDLIQYDVFIRNPEQDVSWWVNNLEGIKREMLVNNIIGIAYSGTVPVYDENNKQLTTEQVKAIGNEPLLKRIQTPTPPYNDTIILVENQLNRQLITKIRFYEEWYFDDQTMQIGKRIVGYTPLIEEYTEDNLFKGYRPLFTLYFDNRYPSVLFTGKVDTLKAENIIRNENDTTKTVFADNIISPDMTTTVNTQSILSERIRYDVPVKDLKSQKEWWIENIDYPKRESFISQLFDLVSTGIIQTYDIFDDSLSISKVREIVGIKSETLMTKSKNPPFRDTIIISVTNNFDYNRISRFRFLEEWYLNEKTAQLSKRVVGFAPLVEIFDENKSIKGYSSLFWIYFDKKYPMRLSQRIPSFKY